MRLVPFLDHFTFYSTLRSRIPQKLPVIFVSIRFCARPSLCSWKDFSEMFQRRVSCVDLMRISVGSEISWIASQRQAMHDDLQNIVASFQNCWILTVSWMNLAIQFAHEAPFQTACAIFRGIDQLPWMLFPCMISYDLLGVCRSVFLCCIFLGL